MLKLTTQRIIFDLWQQYKLRCPQAKLIEEKLFSKGMNDLPLDHFAVIDLPSEHSGISQLSQLFLTLGFSIRGRDYLADKQNDFMWLAEKNCETHSANQALPQVVVADFRLEEMPIEISSIIKKYVSQTKPLPLTEIKNAAFALEKGDKKAGDVLHQLVTTYLNGRDWALPSVHEFYTVREFNELLAWVLIFGRRPNHFTFSIHLLNEFTHLGHFHEFLEQEVGVALNEEGGIIKGNAQLGIAQSSTQGLLQTLMLSDGTIQIPKDFIEFVWRFPTHPLSQPPRWGEFFPHFIAQQANRVIESLYEK